MRISDWSSDVCSSDLAVELVGAEFVIGDGAIAVAVEQAHVVRAVRTVVDGRDDAGGVAGDDRPGAGPAGAGELVEGRATVADRDRAVERAVRTGITRILGVVVVTLDIARLEGVTAPGGVQPVLQAQAELVAVAPGFCVGAEAPLVEVGFG